MSYPNYPKTYNLAGNPFVQRVSQEPTTYSLPDWLREALKHPFLPAPPEDSA